MNHTKLDWQLQPRTPVAAPILAAESTFGTFLILFKEVPTFSGIEEPNRVLFCSTWSGNYRAILKRSLKGCSMREALVAAEEFHDSMHKAINVIDRVGFMRRFG